VATVLQEKQKANLPVSFFHLVAWKPALLFRNSSGFPKLLDISGDRLSAYPLLRGNFHLWICLYWLVFAAFILLSLNNYNPFFLFKPIAGMTFCCQALL
jgi:hypothetical protein